MRPTRTDRIAHVLFVLACAFLAFVAGAFVVLSRTFPHDWLRDAYRGGVAFLARSSGPSDLYRDENLWRVATREDRGVTTHDATRAFEGYTLFTSGHRQSAYLLGMDGTILHEWHMPYGRLWEKGSAVRHPLPDSHIYFRKAVLYPNGDLLALYDGAGDTPHGYGLVKLDRDSHVVWKYLEHAHHDVALAPDGTIYVLIHEIADHVVEGHEDLSRPRIDDSIAVLSADGKERRRIPLLEALTASPFARLLGMISCDAAGKGDYLHTNSLFVVDAATAGHFAFLEEGQLVMSMRELNLIAALDPEQEAFTWGLRGPWALQHDADLLEEGRILLFDNVGDFGSRGASRVLEVDPETMEIVWQYAGSDDRPLESWIRSAQQRLPNGNTLITESNGGRLVEVTPAGEIAWEYVSPVRGGPDERYLPVLSSGTRVTSEELDEDFVRRLEPPRGAAGVSGPRGASSRTTASR